MAQHDYVIANASGATVRADINSALSAIQTLNSGTSAPSSTAAGMLWLDTTGGAPYALKVRDAGNNHWLTLASVTDPGSDDSLTLTGDFNGEILSTATGTFNGTIGSSATFPSGKIINFGVLQNSTRTAIADSSSNDREILDFGDYNKLYASSNLAIHVFVVSESHNAAGAVNIGLKYGSGVTQFSGSYNMPDNGYIGLSGGYYYLTGYTTTGAQAVSFRSGTQQSSGTKPFQIINPNATDDNRLAQTISTAFIYEIQP